MAAQTNDIHRSADWTRNLLILPICRGGHDLQRMKLSVLYYSPLCNTACVRGPSRAYVTTNRMYLCCACAQHDNVQYRKRDSAENKLQIRDRATKDKLKF